MSNNNLLQNTICYTAGPMDFETSGFGLQWRAYLKSVFGPLSIKVLSPYDDTLLNFPVETDEEKKNIRNLLIDKKFDEAHAITKLIVRRDLAMVDKCDFVIANVNPNIHMCGTYHEIFTAKSEQKPIFIFCEDKSKLPFWLVGCIKPQFIFEKIEHIVSYIIDLNTGKSPLDNKYWKILKPEQVCINAWIENGK